MKLQKTTLGLVTLALLLGGFVYFYEIQGKEQREEIKQQQQQVFQFQEADIQSIVINKDGQTLEFEKIGEPDNIWQMKQPENVVASNASLAFLTNLLVNGESSQSFTIIEQDLDDYGLKEPFAEIKVTLNNQNDYTLILGKESFDNNSIYAKKPDNLTVLVVPINFKYAVQRELEEWKQAENDKNLD
jgi:hypothetical protein